MNLHRPTTDQTLKIIQNKFQQNYLEYEQWNQISTLDYNIYGKM